MNVGNKLTPAQWAWVAGLIEGEGYFNIKPQGKSGYWQPCFTLQMTDFDVIEKLHSVTGLGAVNGPHLKGGKRKPIWAWRIGRREEIRVLLKNCLPWFGIRRGARARYILNILPELVPYPVAAIKFELNNGRTIREVAKEFEICSSIVQKIGCGKTVSGYYRAPLRLSS